MKVKIMSIVVVVLSVFSTLFLCCSCFRYETGRHVTFDLENGKIYIVIQGRTFLLLSPEGPFPTWKKSILLKVNTHLMPLDFSSEYKIPCQITSVSDDDVQYGTISFDQNKMIATLHIVMQNKYEQVYKDYLSYQFDGEFPLQLYSTPGR